MSRYARDISRKILGAFQEAIKLQFLCHRKNVALFFCSKVQ